MVLLGDECHSFGQFLDSVNLGARFAPNVPWAWKSFWAHPMVLHDVDQVEAHLGLFGDSVNLESRLVHG
jgi:hypothetical protein